MCLFQYNEKFNTVLSLDKKGMIEYWKPDGDFSFPENLSFKFKTETDLYEFAKVLKNLLMKMFKKSCFSE